MKKNERFGNLVRGMINAIAAFESRGAPIIEEELGERISVAPTTIQGYKQGRVPEAQRAVEVLAEFGVRRAYLNRIWLQRLLESVQYYDTQRLIERLCPTVDTPQRPPRSIDNLPTPTYGHFIMRAAAYDLVVEGLDQRSSLVVIMSMGGMGKTSLALEVAKRCIGQQAHVGIEQATQTAFDAAVWVSDKDQIGKTTLSTVLDAIAVTLNYPGLTRLDPREKLYEVGQLLRQRRVLVIVDNFETVTDAALLDWLLRRLPEPSKALITTRAYSREFQRGAWIVELDGMIEAEVQHLITHLARRLRLGEISPMVLQQLGVATGGNPKALEMALGYAKYTRQPLAQVTESLAVIDTELFDELFGRSWLLIDLVGRQLLAATTLFLASASAEALISVTGIEDLAFDLSIQKLMDLGYLELAQLDDAIPREGRRFALHPLTRAFVRSKRPELANWLDEAQKRWLTWCSVYAGRYGGYQIDDLSRLTYIDTEEPTLLAAITWAVTTERYREAIGLIRDLEFYYYVRALWSKKLELHGWYIEAARQLADPGEEINALALHIQLLSHQGRIDEAANYLPQLQLLADSYQLVGDSFFSYQHTLGIYRLAHKEPATARLCWQRLLDREAELTSHMGVGARHWIARCYYLEGERSKARQYFEAALAAAQAQSFDRFVGRNQLGLALIAIDEGALSEAAERLAESERCTRSDDWEQLARVRWALARLRARSSVDEARGLYEQASMLFERMGLTSERREISAELATLEQ